MIPIPVIAEIESAISSLVGIPGRCLHIAHEAAAVLFRHGYRPVIQAGSLQWPRVRREFDDGRINTHFAYMWDPSHPASRKALMSGRLPEIHVWVGLVDTQEIVDFSTRNLKAAALATGLDWTADEPPTYLWANETTMPDWVDYTLDRDATIFVCGLLWKLFEPDYLKGK